MVGDTRGGANGAKSVEKFLAPEILRKVLGDMRDAEIGIRVLIRSSELCRVKRRSIVV